jgi:hypothetical protein
MNKSPLLNGNSRHPDPHHVVEEDDVCVPGETHGTSHPDTIAVPECACFKQEPQFDCELLRVDVGSVGETKSKEIVEVIQEGENAVCDKMMVIECREALEYCREIFGEYRAYRNMTSQERRRHPMHERLRVNKSYNSEAGLWSYLSRNGSVDLYQLFDMGHKLDITIRPGSLFMLSGSMKLYDILPKEPRKYCVPKALARLGLVVEDAPFNCSSAKNLVSATGHNLLITDCSHEKFFAIDVGSCKSIHLKITDDFKHCLHAKIVEPSRHTVGKSMTTRSNVETFCITMEEEADRKSVV